MPSAVRSASRSKGSPGCEIGSPRSAGGIGGTAPAVPLAHARRCSIFSLHSSHDPSWPAAPPQLHLRCNIGFAADSCEEVGEGCGWDTWGAYCFIRPAALAKTPVHRTVQELSNNSRPYAILCGLHFSGMSDFGS
jgi:hypothetical protein